MPARFISFLLLLLSSIALFAQNNTYQLVCSDEFNKDGSVNDSKWHHQIQLPNGSSWYNNEIQHYTDRTENSSVSQGTLKITALKENFTDQDVTKGYTSARLNSKFAFTYGRVEIRAKLPSGIGTWPAIWMLGKNINEPGGYWTKSYGKLGWPACGEIDIMEHWGNNQDFVQSAMHTPSSSGETVNKGGRTITGVSQEFHVYAMEWTKNEIIFSVDGMEHYRYAPAVKNPETWPYTADQYLLLNLAILPEIQPTIEKAVLEVDYVRVYQEAQ